MKLYWYVAFGAALGGIARFGLSGLIQQRAGPDFPMGTLVINVTGSFILGLIMRYAMQSSGISPELRLFLTTGFCGGYTTFSTFTYETGMLLEGGEYGRAALYVGASVLLSLLAVFLGFAAANQLIALRRAG